MISKHSAFMHSLIYGDKKVTIRIVDGEQVRKQHSPDFVGGGHHYVYPFIPKDEIWIEQEYAANVRRLFFMHEAFEYILMSSKNYSYDRAHEIANKYEQRLRNNEAFDEVTHDFIRKYDIKENVKLAMTREQPKHIYITGAPGSGKSTEAKRLSKELHMPHLNPDEYIAKGKDWKKKFSKLKRPHILEGHYFLDNPPPQGSDVRFMSAPKKELINRVLKRGWTDEEGKFYQGEEHRKATSDLVNYFHKKVKGVKALYKKASMPSKSTIKKWMEDNDKETKDLAPMLSKVESKIEGDPTDSYIKQYDTLHDIAHGTMHVQAVREHAKDLAQRLKYKKNKLVDYAALLHDIGNLKDRDTHHIVGEQMVLDDKDLRKHFSEKEIKAIAHAVRAHRSSDKQVKAKTTLAKIVADADKLDSDVGRAYTYNRLHQNMTDEEALRDAIEHQQRKFGPKGYGYSAIHYPITKKLIKQKYGPILDAYAKGDMKKVREAVEDSRYYKAYNEKNASKYKSQTLFTPPPMPTKRQGNYQRFFDHLISKHVAKYGHSEKKADPKAVWYANIERMTREKLDEEERKNKRVSK